MLRSSLLALSLCASAAFGQSLTPDQIRGLIDERMNNLNPYAELLNDPDPARSLAALQIMMESGDDTLVRMALEFGLLSADPVVRRSAFESFLSTGPILSIRFDGSAHQNTANFASWVTVRDWSGSVGPDHIGYWRVPIGDYSEQSRCYTRVDIDDCVVTVNADGVFFTPHSMNGRGELTDVGTVVGAATLNRISEPVPFSIQLLD